MFVCSGEIQWNAAPGFLASAWVGPADSDPFLLLLFLLLLLLLLLLHILPSSFSSPPAADAKARPEIYTTYNLAREEAAATVVAAA